MIALAHADARDGPAVAVLYYLAVAGDLDFAACDNAGIKRREPRPQAKHAKEQNDHGEPKAALAPWIVVQHLGLGD